MPRLRPQFFGKGAASATKSPSRASYALFLTGSLAG
jgi:hypothetical protein